MQKREAPSRLKVGGPPGTGAAGGGHSEEAIGPGASRRNPPGRHLASDS